MKILILTEGGKNMGFGHITRCVALSDAGKRIGIESELIINGDKSVLGLLKGRKFKILDWLKGRKNLFSTIRSMDAVIIDSYLAEKAFYDSISETCRGKVLMIDDYGRIEYPRGIVVNPSICADKINYSRQDGTVYLLGKDFVILRKEFWNVPRKHIRQEIKDVLITLGGTDHKDLIFEIIKYLKSVFCFNFHVVAPKKNVITAKMMRNLMQKVDLCISAGGQTTYELARVGVPTIGICFAKNQKLNLEALQEKGFIDYIGCYNVDVLLEKIACSVNKLISYEERLLYSQIGRNLIDGEGVQRIVSRVKNLKFAF